jgi:alpha-tubulin suppressor-like RCC1 family protein
MLGRKRISSGVVVALVAVGAVVGACSDKATTGPSKVQGKDFASALRSVDGDQQIGPVAAALTKQLVVKVIDANGLPVEGATVTFNVRGGGGSVNPPANTSSVSGLVSATWTLGTALGANKVVALLTNNYVLDSAVFTATATAGAPRVITVTGGNNQKSPVSRTLGTPLSISLADQFGYPISGVRVTWTPGSLSGTVTPLRDTTSADGSASATWTLGTNAFATQTVVASATGITPVVFTVTTSPDTGRRVAIDSMTNNQAGFVSTQLGQPLKVTVKDQWGNIVSGERITWNDSISVGTTVSSVSDTSKADGTATVNWTMGVRLGQMTLRAKLPSTGAVATFAARANVTYSDVFTGNYFACGVAAQNNYAYCWGAGDAGQLGKGLTPSAASVPAPSTPVTITADSVLGPFLQPRVLSGGTNSLCGLTIAKQLYCWGRVPGLASATFPSASLQNTIFTAQSTLPNLLAVGQEHYCVTAFSGAGRCTGVNRDGQLGDGAGVTPPVGTYLPIADALPTGAQLWSKLSAGVAHTCAIPRFDPVIAQLPYCWGLNRSGQAGQAFSASVLTATRVTITGVTSVDSTSISAGASHTCVISAAPVAGDVYCWGDGGNGQLGTVVAAPATATFTPVKVPGISNAVKLSAGVYHTCAIVQGGAAYCWGRNDFGQLGTTPSAGGPTPVAVLGTLFTTISVGATSTCGLTTGGASAKVRCWGDNTFGQLGQRTTTASSTPIDVKNQPVP